MDNNIEKEERVKDIFDYDENGENKSTNILYMEGVTLAEQWRLNAIMQAEDDAREIAENTEFWIDDDDEDQGKEKEAKDK